MSHRVTVPSDFAAFDEAVYASGAPLPSWVGQRLAANGRWLKAHTRRGTGRAYPLNQVPANGGTATPLITCTRMTTPMVHIGTPGCQLLGGAWYLLATLDLDAEAIVRPYVLAPPLMPIQRPRLLGGTGEVTIVGTGAEAIYGPIPAPCVEGESRIGLVVTPLPQAGGKADEGDVYQASGRTIVGTARDFASLVAPIGTYRMPAIRVLDADGDAITPLCEIASVGQTFVAGDTAFCADDVLAAGRAIGPSEACTYEVWPATEIGAVMLQATYFRELAEPAGGP
jgi:hypothetical protein